MTDAGGGVNGAWKWLAGILVAILLTGAPGIVYGLRTWSLAGNVSRIQDRQDDVRTRLAVLEVQNSTLFNQVVELRAELARHAQQEK